MTRLASLTLVLAALFACRDKPAPDATAADIAAAEAACREERDHKPDESRQTLAAYRAWCATNACPSLSKIAAICHYYGPNTQGHYHVHTTLSGGDEKPRSELCGSLRASEVIGSISPITIHCAGGKSCTTCGGPGGHR